MGDEATLWCPINQPIEGSNEVCLGAGVMCEGGTYKGGPGYFPKCHYETNPSGLILFYILVLMTIWFTRLNDKLEHWVPNTYKAVLHAAMTELATLGFVSLVAFFIKYKWDARDSWLDLVGKELGLGDTLHKSFEELHFLLFGLSISFILFCSYFLTNALKRLRKFEVYQGHINEIVDKHKGLPQIGNHIPQINWMARLTEEDRQEIFFRIHDRFTDSENVVQGDLHIQIPRNFDLSKYLMMASSKIMAEVVEIHPVDWLFVQVLATISWIAWYYTSGQSDDPDATDGGYIVFWIYEAAFAVIGLLLDRKVHNILVQLIPAVENTIGKYSDPLSSHNNQPREEARMSRQNSGGGGEERLSIEEEQHRRRSSFLMAMQPTRQGARTQGSNGPKIDGVDAPNGGGHPIPGAAGVGLDMGRRGVKEPTSDGSVWLNDLEGGSKSAEGSDDTAVGVAVIPGGGTEMEGISLDAGAVVPEQVGATLQAFPTVDEVDMEIEPELVGGANFGHSGSDFVGGAELVYDGYYVAGENFGVGDGMDGPEAREGQNVRIPVEGGQIMLDKMTHETDESRRERFVPPYIQLSNERLIGRSWLSKKLGGKVINHHQNLFWFQENGPKLLLHLIRHQALSCCVFVVISLVMYRNKMLCTGAPRDQCDGYTTEGIVVFGVSILLPLLGAAFLSNTLSNFTVACNVEYMKSASLIKEVLQKAREKRTVKLFGALLTLATLIDGIKALSEEIHSTRDDDLPRPNSQDGGRSSMESFVRKSMDVVRPGFLRSEAGRHGQDYDRFASTEKIGRSVGAGVINGESAKSRGDAKGNRRSLEHRFAASGNSLEQGSGFFSPISTRTSSLDLKRKAPQAFSKTGRFGKKQVKMLNREVVQQWEDLFREADTEGAGELDKDNFRALVKATGTLTEDSEADLLFQIMDADGNGKVDFEEFIAVMAQEKSRKLDAKTLADTIWGLFDPKRTGRIYIEEMKETLKRFRPRYDSEGAMLFMHDIDIDRRGYVTRGEFELFVNRIVFSVQ